MVYKIQGLFTVDNFDNILTKVSKRFKVLYLNGVMYIAPLTYNSSNDEELYIKKVFKPTKSFLITPINEQNIMGLSPVVKEWCRNNLVALETQKYESEQQVKLKQVWKAMDNMEAQLDQEVLIKQSS